MTLPIESVLRGAVLSLLCAAAACSSPAPSAGDDDAASGSGAVGSSAAAAGGQKSTGGAPSAGDAGNSASRGGAAASSGASGSSGSGTSSAGGATAGMSAVGGASGSAGAVTGGTSQAGNAAAGATSSGGPPNSGAGGTSAGTSGSNAGSSGSNGGNGSDPSALDLIVAPDGKSDAPGTLDAPTTLTAALPRITAGHTIFARGGSYVSAAQISIARDNSGTSTEPKSLVAYGSERPVLDFSSEPYGSGSNPRGLQINGSYWHVRGFEVKGAADNGIYVAGNDNVIERCVVHGNRDTGLQIGRESSSDADIAAWPSNNLVLDCESYDNYDAPPGSGENADGFAAKLTVGPGNVFRGCVSHNNIDDGWDLFTKTDTGPIGPVTIDQCISYRNGTLTDGTTNDNGDRNGFKLGGDDIAVAHVVTRSIAFENGKNGFTWNSNPGAIRLSNNLAFDNVEGNFKFGDSSTTTAAVFTNNVSFWTQTSGTQSDKALGTDTANTNAWWDNSKKQATIAAKGIVVSASDFANSLANPKLATNGDGSPDFTPFALAKGSALIDAGALPNGALPFDAATYYSGAPDLGAVEAR